MQKAVLFFIVCSFKLAWASEPSCDARYVNADAPNSICSEWRRPESGSILQRSTIDGIDYIVANPFSMKSQQSVNRELNDVSTAASVSAVLWSRVQSEIDLIRQSMISQILTNSNRALLSNHQRFLLYRLENLNIRLAAESDPACQAALFNASYDQGVNSMKVCPLVAHSLPETWIALVAHEFGHLADPCNYGEDYVFSNTLSNDSKTVRVAFDACIDRNDNQMTVNEKLDFKSWISGGGRLESRHFTVYPENATHRLGVQALIRCRLVEERRGPSAPRTYLGSPYLSIISCVSRNYPRPEILRASNTLPGASVQGKNSDADTGITQLPPTPISETSAVSASGPVCDARMQVKENTADHIGMALLAYHLARNPRRYRVGENILYFYNSVNCTETNSESDPLYGSATLRLTEFLNHPALRRAVGCRTVTQAALCTAPWSMTQSESPR